MASVDSNHSNSRLLGSSHHDGRRRQRDDDQEFEMRVPLQPHHKHENYENMDNYPDDPSHQYEDPGRFQGDTCKGPKLPVREPRGTPRKKKNDVYEPAKRRQRRYTDSSSEGSYDGPPRRDPCWQCVRVMVFFIFFLALSALALIGMIVLGYVPIKACNASCSPIEVPERQAASDSGDSELSQTVKELSANLKALEAILKDKNDIINDLQRRDTEQSGRIAKLESKMPLIVDRSGKLVTNLTAVVGPRGPPGFNGSQGPPGPKGLPGKANMSACQYRVQQSSPSTPGGSPSVSIIEMEGEKIMSTTCSTDGASEYNLKSRTLFDGKRQYTCECKGTSVLFKATADGKSFCYIHYWTCSL